MLSIEFDLKSDTGCVREHNEDSVYASTDPYLWIVADGMGGYACGEVASKIAVNTIAAEVQSDVDLTPALLTAHQAIISHSEQHPESKGMGATVVVLSISGNQFRIIWSGDSRAYLLRNNKLQKLTTDHSYYEWLLQHGAPEETAKKQPDSHKITQGLGLDTPEPDEISGTLQAGDRFLLCSDGLSNELTKTMIFSTLKKPQPCSSIVNDLIKQALDRGARDNVSVIVVDLPATGLTRLPLVRWIKQRLWNPMRRHKHILLPALLGFISALMLIYIALHLKNNV